MAKKNDSTSPWQQLTATLTAPDGAEVGRYILRRKTFSSGNTGYHSTGRLETDDEAVRFMVNLQIARIKPKK